MRALVEMGVFEALPIDGTSLSANVLAEKLKVEKDLLVRLMRVAIPEYVQREGETMYRPLINIDFSRSLSPKHTHIPHTRWSTCIRVFEEHSNSCK